MAALPLGTSGLSPWPLFPLVLFPELGGLSVGLPFRPFSDRDDFFPGYAGACPSSDPGLEEGRVPFPLCVPGCGVVPVEAVPVATVLEGVLEAEGIFEGVLDGVFGALLLLGMATGRRMSAEPAKVTAA